VDDEDDLAGLRIHIGDDLVNQGAQDALLQARVSVGMGLDRLELIGQIVECILRRDRSIASRTLMLLDPCFELLDRSRATDVDLPRHKQKLAGQTQKRRMGGAGVCAVSQKPISLFG